MAYWHLSLDQRAFSTGAHYPGIRASFESHRSYPGKPFAGFQEEPVSPLGAQAQSASLRVADIAEEGMSGEEATCLALAERWLARGTLRFEPPDPEELVSRIRFLTIFGRTE